MGQNKISCDQNSAPLQFAEKMLEKALAEYPVDVHVELYAGICPRWLCKAEAQGYTLYIDEREKLAVVAGADEAGALYGALDLAEQFRLGNALENIKPATVSPFLEKRGIKFNIPLDARTPSYGDNGDSAQENIKNVWDIDFWHGFLDRMAENKYNVLSLWNMSPGPSMVRVPEYPDVALSDIMRAAHPPRSDLRGMQLYTPVQEESMVTIKRMTIGEKIAFWREVMAYAHDRCIDVYLFFWNAYVYGTEHTSYGITDRADNPITQDYLKRTTEALVRTYPLLAGMGVTAGENMRIEWKTDVREDIEWTRAVYGQGIIDALRDDPERTFTLIHRSHMTTLEQMEDVYADFPYPFEVSYKYSMAHVYSTPKPHFGDSFFAQIKDGGKGWLTVRDDDFYMLRWGDAAFVRDYLRGMPRQKLRGFYIGPDGLVWGKQYACRDLDQKGMYYFDRHWFSFLLWGRLSYDIDLSEACLRSIMAGHYDTDADAVYDAMSLASRAITMQQRVYWNDFDFHWYPEACCSYLQAEDLLIFRTLNDFLSGKACPGTGYLSIREYADAVCDGAPMTGISPGDVVKDMQSNCLRALEILKTIHLDIKAADQDMIEDIKAMAYLGLYYAAKIQAAVDLLVCRQTGDQARGERAVEDAKEAYGQWLAYSSSIAARYRPQRLGRLRNYVSPDQFDDYAKFDIAIAKEALLR